MTITARQLLTEAVQEIGVVGEGEIPSADLLALPLQKLARLLDQWNATRPAVYADVLSTFTISPETQPHTIGPSGATWTLARPVTIEDAQLVLNTSSPAAHVPIWLHGAQWWSALTVPTLTSAVPTDGWYNPTAPNGSLYLWPVPTTAYPVLLRTRVVLTDVTFATALVLPPGYREALTLTLAEALIRPFDLDPAALPTLARDAAKARAIAFANNQQPPRICTQDAGMPTASRASSFNYLSRTWDA